MIPAHLATAWSAFLDWADPDRVTCGWVNATHEPLDSEETP